MISLMSRALLLGLVLVGALAAGPSIALAQFYRWVDERGTAHFAERLDNVPELYRSVAVPLGFSPR